MAFTQKKSNISKLSFDIKNYDIKKIKFLIIKTDFFPARPFIFNDTSIRSTVYRRF